MGGLFGKTPSPPPIPPPAPLPDQTAINAAQQRSVQAAMLRSGRLSTILTDAQGQQQKLGAGQ